MGEILIDADYVSRSRGVVASTYFIITPANRVPNALPFFEKIVVWPLVVPRFGMARFGEYLLEQSPGALTSRAVEPGFEHFFYQLEGTTTLETEAKTHVMSAGGFAYLPDTMSFALRNNHPNPGKLLWIKKRYEQVGGLAAPTPIFSHRNEGKRVETNVVGTWAQRLTPLSDPAFDMGMLLLSFDRGVYFDQVEIHHQEHGLYMLRGQGVYFLGGSHHEVKQDDFIYMAPFCPQYFYATGWDESEYLLYKDINRDGF